MKYNFRNKNVLILGLGKSGLSSLTLLSKMGAFCYVYDDYKLKLNSYGLYDTCNIVSRVDDYLVRAMDFMILSPSISIYSEYVKLAKLYGVKVLSEMELGLSQVKGTIIGITGTNGKTTTSSLTQYILKQAKKPSILCGNVGKPVTENILPYKSNYVVEMSSFQLESLQTQKVDIGAILNITPNHLDRHFNFTNYRDAKFNLFKNMTRKSTLILNYDDKTLRMLKNKKLTPKVIWISKNHKIDGFYAQKNKIFYKHKNRTKYIADISSTKLLGEHNIYNILVSVAICKKLKVKNSIIEFCISNFEPIEHRIQFVKNVNGVDYINDSKSTSPDSTITAIKTFKKSPLVLLLGGSDKNTSFDRLAKQISLTKNIKLIIVCGETSKKIIESLKKYHILNFQEADTFLEALQLATKCAEIGDTVLLSPACASFDFFTSYEERGEKFIEYVESLK